MWGFLFFSSVKSTDVTSFEVFPRIGKNLKIFLHRVFDRIIKNLKILIFPETWGQPNFRHTPFGGL